MKTSKTPEIRFKTFSTKWSQKRLNELMEESKLRNQDSLYDKSQVLSVSGEFGVVNQIEHLGRSYAGVSIKNYHVVNKGDIVYTKSPLKQNPYGIIKVNKNKAGVVSTLYAVYRTNETVSADFLDYYFQLGDHTNKYLRPLVRKGAKNDMKINNGDVLKDSIFIPDIDEQNSIVDFLSEIDKNIFTLKQKKDFFQKYKKQVIKQIFEQKIKFKDSKGSFFKKWQFIKLSDVADVVNLKNTDRKITETLTNSAIKGIIKQSDYFDRDIVNNKNIDGYYVVKNGDFVYNPRVSKFAPVGPIGRNNTVTGIVSPLYSVFRFFDKNTDFYESYFKSSYWYKYVYSVANYGARHDRISISSKDFLNLPLPNPSLEEQKVIFDFLASLDKYSENIEDSLSKVSELKKGLLQQMFV